MTRVRICIVSAGSLSSGPRVVKEADALAAAGFDVHVVACHTLPWMAASDAALARARSWSYSAVDMSARRGLPGLQRLAASVGSRLARGVGDALGPLAVVDEMASSPVSVPLLAAVRREARAALYIGHNLPALAVVRVVAALARARHAFDAEDDHFGQLTAAEQAGPLGAPVRALLDRHLPSCAYVTAASPQIATSMGARHRIPTPTVIRNVFPWSARGQLDGARVDRLSDAPSLYWYSQSLGLDRGLQDLIRAAGRLRGPFQIHLRGDSEPDVRDALRQLALESGVADRLHFHGQVAPDELLSRTAEHDIGFALEQPVSDNRMSTMTNKLFFYLLAGLAVAATDTPGQAAVLAARPDAGFLYPPGESDALAARLQAWLDDPAALRRARAAALSAARDHFNWEREQDVLVEVVRRSLASAQAD